MPSSSCDPFCKPWESSTERRASAFPWAFARVGTKGRLRPSARAMGALAPCPPAAPMVGTLRFSHHTLLRSYTPTVRGDRRGGTYSANAGCLADVAGTVTERPAKGRTPVHHAACPGGRDAAQPEQTPDHSTPWHSAVWLMASAWPRGYCRCHRNRTLGRLPIRLTLKSHGPSAESDLASMFVAFPFGKPVSTFPGNALTARGRRRECDRPPPRFCPA
jgi:hypothetical protein